MLLESIQLGNFRQFYGEQNPISFSTDSNKNVTVIMGDNGSGKTTLSQAFSWCLYGSTDFKNPKVYSLKASKDLKIDEEFKVSVKIELIHNRKNYIIERTQLFKKTSKKIDSEDAKLSVLFKDESGKTQSAGIYEKDLIIKSILPKELAKYFFFDGESIEKMSKDLKKGKSQEFAEAIKRLLGLKSLMLAKEHLKEKNTNVIGEYNKKIVDSGNREIEKYDSIIRMKEKEIENNKRTIPILKEENEKIDDKIKIQEKELDLNKASKGLAEAQRAKKSIVVNKKNRKNERIREILNNFNKNGLAYLRVNLANEAVEILKNTEKMDKGVPSVDKKTIDFLLERKKCICGAFIEKGDKKYEELKNLLEFIPPKSMGTLLSEFEIEIKHNESDQIQFYENFESGIKDIRLKDIEINSNIDEINDIVENLKGLKDAGKIQIELMRLKRKKKENEEFISRSERKIGELESFRKAAEKSKDKLAALDERNKEIIKYKAYATYIYRLFSKEYERKEIEVRNELQKNINSIFREIYNGGISLEISNKYEIKVIIDELNQKENDIDTSTAQSMSIIFAFIAGIIKKVRDNNAKKDEKNENEVYPLVMDAPLSAFDKTRINTICTVLPRIAEQVIIFIKDTDGQIAEDNMKDKIGKKYRFNKVNEILTRVEER